MSLVDTRIQIVSGRHIWIEPYIGIELVESKRHTGIVLQGLAFEIDFMFPSEALYFCHVISFINKLLVHDEW